MQLQRNKKVNDGVSGSCRIGLKKAAAFFTFILIACIFTGNISAVAPYDTYTYSYSGNVQISPAAYEPVERTIDFGEIGILKSPNDIFYDSGSDRLFIADTGNDRIVVTDRNLKVLKTITGFSFNGKQDSFCEPHGVFVNGKGNL